MTKTTNPFNHPFPHAKLYNVKLTPISRLVKNTEWLSQYMVKDKEPEPVQEQEGQAA